MSDIADLYDASSPSDNTFNMVGEVDEAMLLAFLRFLNEYDKSGSVKINLCTYGGDADIALGIYDLLRGTTARMDAEPSKGRQLIIRGVGVVMSAGAFILQAAHHRLLLPNTVMMLHYGSREVNDTHVNFESFAESNSITSDNLCKILSDRSGKEYSAIHQWLLKDTYLTAHVAVANGLADRVVAL